MQERVQKIISNSGYCARRKAEELIEKGMVEVNGEKIKLGTKANKTKDTITINGTTLKLDSEFHYYILNKPKQILVTKQDPEGRRVIYDLNAMLDLRDQIHTELNYVGRLDGMSEGLLLLTNDGDLNNLLTHPKHHAPKVYNVRTEPEISAQDIKKIEQGIMIDDKKVFAHVSTIKDNIFSIEIREGRNRIVRRLLEEALNYKIYLLKRVSMASLELGNLETGQLRKIPTKDIEKLKKDLINDKFSYSKKKSNKDKIYEKSAAQRLVEEKFKKDGVKINNPEKSKFTRDKKYIKKPNTKKSNNKYSKNTNFKSKDKKFTEKKEISSKKQKQKEETSKSSKKNKKPFYANAIKFSKRNKK